MSRISAIEKIKNEKPTEFNEFLNYVRYHTYEETATKYATFFGIETPKLLSRLPVWGAVYKFKGPPPQSAIAKPNEKSLSPNGLSSEELVFLDKFRKGEVSFEHVQREFAYRVFKKILENPELLKVADWLRSEVIKIQREELSMKKENMERSWAMLFSGFLIPKLCPKCGFDLQPKVSVPIGDNALKIIRGEEINDTKPMGVTESVSQPQS
jgi:hypothetical protein